jgi:hypothetical protein
MEEGKKIISEEKLPVLDEWDDTELETSGC